MASLCEGRQHGHIQLNQILVLQKGALPLIYFALAFRKPSFILNSATHTISELFSYSTEMQLYDTRFASSDNLFFNYSKSSHQFKSFRGSGVKLWNNTPPHLQRLPIFIFKKKNRVMFT